MDNPNENLSGKEDNTQIRKPKTSLLGILLMVSVVFLAICIFMPPRPPNKKNYQMICGTNLHMLGKTMMLYASDNNDRYPTAEKWCDLLIQYLDRTPRQFICRGSDVVKGESSYAFNKNLAGKKVSEVPGDVVVLFETNFGKTPVGRGGFIGERDYNKALGISDPNREVYKLRWNQVGGPEILTTDNHKGKGCWVSFNDSHVEFVKTEKLKDLKWKPEETK